MPASVAALTIVRAVSNSLFLAKRFADVAPFRGEECVRHRAADHQHIDFCDEVFEQRDLGRNFRAADHRHHRMHGIAERLVQMLELCLHRAPRSGRQQMRQPFRRGVRAVRGRKRIVDVDVAQARELLGECPDRLPLRPDESACSPAAECRRSSAWRRRLPLFRPRNRLRMPPAFPRLSTAPATIGFSDMDGTTFPFGRSKWDSTITFAPLSDSSRMVGACRSMREASVTWPFFIGTLRSARTSTRLPFTSRSSSVRNLWHSDQLPHRDGGIRHAVGEAPFVVIPAHDGDEIAVHHLGLIERKTRRMRVVIEIMADELCMHDRQNVLQRTVRRRDHRIVYFLDRWSSAS